MIMESLTEKMTFEQRHERGEGGVYVEVRAFQAEVTASAKGLWQEWSWHIGGHVHHHKDFDFV